MPTVKQKLGQFGEKMVVRYCRCPGCKRTRTFKLLRANFKCADIVCDFCCFLAQVKACTVRNCHKLPKQLLGAAWGPQKERMDAAIYFPLFLVLVNEKDFAIYYLSADLQLPELFLPRDPLSDKAHRAGWQGFLYDLGSLPAGAMVKVYPV